MKRLIPAAFVLALALSTAGCVVPATQSGEVEIRQGRIEQILPAQIQNSHMTGIGAIIGGASGFGIGNLIGNGNGRDVARVLGVLGGALAGNEVQKRYDQPQPAQQVVVRTSTGVLVSVIQPIDPSLRAGQSVYIDGYGEGARVIPR